MDASSPIMSWLAKPTLQQPEYPDVAHRDRVLDKLRSLPPLVTSWEIERLKSLLADAAAGKRFVLQGGDCAESLADCTPDAITGKLKILLQMSLVLVFGGHKPVVRIGRIAGQYAKPRSAPTETRDDQTLPSYFGDLINEYEFTTDARRPNPQLMVRGYQHAAMTLNFIRSLIDGGFADLHHPEYWDLDFCDNADLQQEYLELVQGISQSIEFMESVGEAPIHELTRVEFFTSHEGLNLLYESAGTRTVPRRTGYYNLTTHFPWIGDRTRALTGAHVEYFRQIRNPIGIKVGPSADPDELLSLCDVLDPEGEPGRITLIHRFGAQAVQTHLTGLIDGFQNAGRRVLWLCDPMHGNTRSTKSGRKTRDYEAILAELDASFDLHRNHGSHLGGVHFELTGEHVTECTGGARRLTDEQLSANYRSTCDPRLNYEQALELAFRIARRIRSTPATPPHANDSEAHAQRSE
ncbi:MAG: 3-deoxy-7-phosphoheptulonate synthase class II [Planctomycetes bacterium]|nr:3-deoxy-7-phosphoheptulonate synthase class II [Planctomycetota bacterium]NOG53675.1 3-deoxy-7-phosphoheptulonate synthase class II [Planctomycetota bacterium]